MLRENLLLLGTVAVTLSLVAGAADAAGPLSDRQLDRVTAGASITIDCPICIVATSSSTSANGGPSVNISSVVGGSSNTGGGGDTGGGGSNSGGGGSNSGGGGGDTGGGGSNSGGGGSNTGGGPVFGAATPWIPTYLPSFLQSGQIIQVP